MAHEDVAAHSAETLRLEALTAKDRDLTLGQLCIEKWYDVLAEYLQLGALVGERP
jgi:hypothetical protein